MIELFKKLLGKWSCLHIWTVHCEVDVWDKFISNDNPIKVRQTLICSKCGKITKIKL